MPGDRWAADDRYGPQYQLATMQTDYARLVANGQPLELHGDNLYLTLDLSAGNLPRGSLLRLGEAVLCVTPQAHNGCKKWAQRFGLDAMKLHLSAEQQGRNLRGIYLEVVESGRVSLGDAVQVMQRGVGSAASEAD
jgi:MOSC domain-containing protein YiiM